MWNGLTEASAPDTEYAQQPDDNPNDNYSVQNRFDRTVHWNKTVDEP